MPKTVYYGSTADAAAKIGFDDRFINDVIRGEAKEERVRFSQHDRDILSARLSFGRAPRAR